MNQQAVNIMLTAFFDNIVPFNEQKGMKAEMRLLLTMYNYRVEFSSEKPHLGEFVRVYGRRIYRRLWRQLLSSL